MQVEERVVMQRGRPTEGTSILVDGKRVTSIGRLFKIARMEEEWYEDIDDPTSFIRKIKESGLGADIFTFWQRLPDTKPRYDYYREWESVAALPITDFNHWWNIQINPKTRNLVRKAEKMGIVVRETTFTDEFIKGMTAIFNETPIRQGKPFWHYGKDYETIKREFSQNLSREVLFGAYYQGELIGFIFLAYAGNYASLTQIISKIEHRDKAPNNALVAKAVEVCANKGIRHLLYAMWSTGSLGDFKRHNGFEKIDLPRYYCPLTHMGMITLKFNLHHGIVGIIPENIKARLIDLRRRWFANKQSTQKTEGTKKP